MSDDELVARVKKHNGLVYMVQNVAGTEIWAVAEKGDLGTIVDKARRYDVVAETLGEEPVDWVRRMQTKAKPWEALAGG